MEWYTAFFLLMGSFFTLVLMGVPVVFSFFGVNIVFLGYFMGSAGFELFIDSMYGSLSNFVLLPITLFILMGEIMFRTGIAHRMIATLDTWLSDVPGRLSLLSVGSGALLATLSGASIGSTAMLTRTLAPMMQSRGYSTAMTIGPLLGSGGIAILIPPSALGVILAVIAGVSVGKLLVAIVIPGLLLVMAFIIYVVVRCTLDKTAAPKYDSDRIPIKERLVLTCKYVLPLSIVIFCVIGTVFIGIATPTEAAALGTLGAFLLTVVYGACSWAAMKEALVSTMRTSVMVLSILAASQAFTQLLAYTGATQELVVWASALSISPLLLVILMHLITLLLGGPIGGVPLIMMTVPVFIPIVKSLGYDPIWFCVAMLINVELAQITPPFGILLFVVKGILPNIAFRDIIKAAVPIILCNVVVMGLVIAFSDLALWLPRQMAQ
ncbi:TRAP transporter large permease [Pusillimonas caeni]|uniref:TRAP transporter large permease n=1 Tax=Pusillimonas caeni TaxID=1348472 RepID=UPI000E59AA83|nr:TRAP transporter large permease [Pusillimonas caeni]TFL14125.1 TRAP transporter large permease [Pusillimonas caeni]